MGAETAEIFAVRIHPGSFGKDGDVTILVSRGSLAIAIGACRATKRAQVNHVAVGPEEAGLGNTVALAGSSGPARYRAALIDSV